MAATTTAGYLDYLATTPLCEEAIAAMRAMLDAGREPAAGWGNPGSAHVFGYASLAMMEKARRQVADLIGCAPEEIVFESGATESINHAIKGTLAAAASTNRNRIVSSAVEHPAVEQTVSAFAQQGNARLVTIVPVDAQGIVDPRRVVEAVEVGRTALVTIMLANNETGAVNDIKEIARLVKLKDPGVCVHTDASQAVGKIPVDVKSLGVDLLTVAGHKLYGPKGIGALFVRNGQPLGKVALGAGQEHGRRAGTENVLLAVGFGAACEAARQCLESEALKIAAMKQELLGWLKVDFPGLLVNSPPDRVLPGALSVSLPGLLGPDLVQKAAEAGVCFSAGAACHAHDKPKASAVLLAMPGMTESRALGTIRLSLGRYTTRDELLRARAVLKQAVRRAKAKL